jgi:hypothetical protein
MRIVPRLGTRGQKLAVTAVAALGVLGLAVASLPRSAVADSTTTTIADAQTGQCLDSNSSGAVFTDSCTGGNTQWTVTPVGNPAVTITNVATGQCLDSNTSTPATPGLGGVYTDQCDSTSTSQQWYVAPDLAEDGGLIFMDVQTGRILDSNYASPGNPIPGAGAVYANTGNGGNYQNWKVASFPLLPVLSFSPSAAPVTTTIVDGTTGRVLDSNYASPDNPAPGTGAVYADSANGGNYQNWTVTAMPAMPQKPGLVSPF